MTNKTSNYLNSTQMTLKHMGSRYPSRLSFSRSMLRATVSYTHLTLPTKA